MKPAFVGKWRIDEMDAWDLDYIDMEELGYIAFKKGGSGGLHFGCVDAILDWRYDASLDRVDFTFDGNDEGDEVTGRGWAKIDGKRMLGQIVFHLGEESGFKARVYGKTIKTEKLKTDMARWPKSWAGFDSDIPIGEEIIKAMHPFVAYLIEEGLAYTTINRHVNNLWLLGGEIIRHIQDDSEPRALAGAELLLRFVDDEGGPFSRHLVTEGEQRTFDATCKKLYRFMLQRSQGFKAGGKKVSGSCSSNRQAP